ncbi:hypothetical protein KSS87_000868 [Heliosperma pusillum]|nr:hypothetical protein KSS87_000868 [Heliosperma pusillum]
MYKARQTLLLLRRSLHTISHERPSESLKRKIADLQKKRKSRNPKKNELFVEVPESRSFLDTATIPMMLTAVGVALFAKLLMMVSFLFSPNPDPYLNTFNPLSDAHGDCTNGMLKYECQLSSVQHKYDESRSQELIERRIQNAPAGQGSVRMLSREEWDEIREVRPRTPFESKLARPNARIRTEAPPKKVTVIFFLLVVMLRVVLGFELGPKTMMEDVKNWAIDVLMDAVTRAEESARNHSK